MTRPTVLPYAVRRRTRPWRLVSTALLVVAVAMLAKRYGRAVWSQATLLERQRACLNYVPVPCAIVYATSEANPNYGGTPPACLSVFSPDILMPAGGRGWFNAPDTVVFLGSLDSGHGSRLVIVSLGVRQFFYGIDDPPTVNLPMPFDVYTVVPAGLLGRPRLACESSTWDWRDPVGQAGMPATRPAAHTFTISAGRVDPACRSDFVAAYTTDGVTGTIRGHLSDDDRVTLKDESPKREWGRTRALWDGAN